jgi:threonine aldolase
MTIERPTFASDNWSGMHPDVLAAVVAANGGQAAAYGADRMTAEAIRLFRQHFGDGAEVFFAFNGTGANIVGLASMLLPFQSVICADTAHINTDECGALERQLGSKLITVATPDGKLTPDLVEAAATGRGNEHHVQPRVVSITQSTELGTCYRPEEVSAIASWVHRHGMFLHLDGARLSNAAAFLEVDLGDFGRDCGVDVLSFGGTKNGAMGADAVVVLRTEYAWALPYIRKQSLQLASKMRFISAQFVALLTDDLWRRNAEAANAMAQRLADGVSKVPGVTVSHPVQSNAVFATLPSEVTEKLQLDYPFHLWNETTGQARWMASFDTTEEDVDGFVKRLAELS